MTITTTQVGTYTVQFTLLNETSAAGLITALDAAVVAAGWAQYDIYANGTQRVYRCLNKDGITFKYIKLFIDPVGLKIATMSFESWNATTHVATNECASYSHLGACGFSLSGSDVVLMISTRWCIVQSFIREQPSQWSGVIEVQREAPEDTAAAGFPCFVWVSSSTIMSSKNGYWQMAAFPRTRGGLTGTNASAVALQTPYTRIGTGGVTSNGLNAYAVYPWDTTKRVVHSLRPVIGTTEVHGRMYGLKAMHTVGAPYSRITMPVDTEFNYSATGTATEHWVLGESAQSTTAGGNLSWSTYGPLTGAFLGITTTPAPYAARAAIFTGNSYYVAHLGGVAKYDSSPALAQTYGTIPGSGADSWDIIYDGKYVYVSTPSGVNRIDPVTDAVTSLALPNGANALFSDGTSIWAGARGYRANNTLYKIDSATFTLTATITIQPANYGIGGICSDFNGNLYISIYDVTTLINIIYKLVISTGTISLLVNTAMTCAVTIGTGIYFDGYYLHTASANGSNTWYNVYNLAGTLQMTSGTLATSYNSAVARLYITRVGQFIQIGGCAQAAALTGASVLSLGLGVAGAPTVATSTMLASGLPVPASATGIPGSLVCDGNRAYCITSGGDLITYDNINHPDDNGTYATSIRARLVLPK